MKGPGLLAEFARRACTSEGESDPNDPGRERLPLETYVVQIPEDSDESTGLGSRGRLRAPGNLARGRRRANNRFR